MSAVKSLLLAIDVATRNRDQAGQGLMHVQNAYLFAQDQMTQLAVYAAETESRWMAATQISTTPELMGHHYQFMGRLHHAIGMQKDILENASRKVDVAKRLVLEAEFRLVSLNRILKRKQTDMALVQARREQKQMDEFAAMQSRQSMGGHFSGERS